MQIVLDSDGNRVKLVTLGTNGRIHYGKGMREETPQDRARREAFWRSLGKKVRKGSTIKSS